MIIEIIWKFILVIEFDLVVKFWYGHYTIDPYLIYPTAKKAVCVYDYIYWNCQINKTSNYPVFHTYFFDSLKNSDYILFACPAIKTLIKEKFSNFLFEPKLRPVYDGYDQPNFFTKNMIRIQNWLLVGLVICSTSINAMIFWKKLVRILIGWS